MEYEGGEMNRIILILIPVSMLTACSGALGNVAAVDPTERGLSYIAAAIVTHAIISLFR